jgi:hypothetical protein
LLAAKLARLRTKCVATAALTGVAIALGVTVELLALALFADWWLDLAWGVRLVLLFVQAGVFGFILAKFILLPILHPPDDDELALMVEKARPLFRSRLIGSIQLTRPGAIPTGQSAALAAATVEETEALAAPMDFNQIVPTDRLRTLGLVALVVTALGVFGLVYGGPDTWTLLRRAFLAHVPVPRKTRVFVSDGDKVIGRGDSVRLEAFAQGIVPGRGKVEIKYSGRRTQEFPLEQNKDNRAHFGRSIENVQDSFTYVIFLNDGRSESFSVKALPRPGVASIQCEQQFPAYTKLPPLRRSLGDLSLLAGSVLQLKITATKDLRAALVKTVGDDREIPLQVEGGRQLLGQFTIPTNGMTGFSIQMLDTEGMESRDAAVYRVEIVPDKVPVVRITYPERKEELYTRQATVLIGVEASDDFEIGKVRLRYKVDTVDNGEEKVAELELGGEHPQRLRRRHEWALSQFSPALREGSLLEYWIEVVDNNNVTGPGVGVSEHQYGKIVSEADKRADLFNRAGDYLGSISDVASDQQKVNRNLGALILEKR